MSQPPRTFTLTEDHIKLLRRAYVRWEDCEYGAPSIDCKRPYGNSGVASDVAEILGWDTDPEDGPTKKQRDAARQIHEETEMALQIILCTGQFTPGDFYRSNEYDYRSWTRYP